MTGSYWFYAINYAIYAMRKHVASIVPNDSDSRRHHPKRYILWIIPIDPEMPEYQSWIYRHLPRGRATCCYIYGVERERINYSKQLILNTLPSRKRTDVVQCLHSDQGHHHHGHKKHHHGRRHHEYDDERSEEEEVSTKDSHCQTFWRYFRKQLLRQAWKK